MSESIMVVDDVAENRVVLGSILVAEGFVVRIATSGHQAVQSSLQAPPDLILLDVMMPELDGYAVCRQFKADPALRKIPIIFISALDTVDEKVRGFEAGAVDYITKPFQTAEVMARIRTHLQLTQLERLMIEDEQRRAAEADLRQAIAEKDVLIEELHHRSGNTALLIRSILSLQARFFPENQQLQRVVKTTEDRIRVIAMANRLLFESGDLAHLSLRTYLMELVHVVVSSMSSRSNPPALELDIVDERLSLDLLVALGLVVNELVTNSLKHGLADLNGSRIVLSVTKSRAATYRLHYFDNGPGFPADFDSECSPGFGLRLIKTIAEVQLKGQLRLYLGGDPSTTIEFVNDLTPAQTAT